jgi:ABC-type dipeptide/oligopeptide/nickel transport system permease component
VSHLIAEVESTLFFSAARAKGLSETQAITKHALKYIFADILSLFPPVFTQLVTGSILVEILFSIDGLGSLFLSAIIYRDITLVCILTLLFSVFLIFSRMIADSLSLYFDPRLRKLGH